MPEVVPSRLVIGIGNPSRGDDALGSMFIERLAQLELPDTELLTDFQLQIEYLLDLQGRAQVIFVDASVRDDAEPYAFLPAVPQDDHSTTSHALSPQALLAAYGKFSAEPLPEAHLLAIRGYSFELGEELSSRAAVNLQAALNFLAHRLGGAPTISTGTEG